MPRLSIYVPRKLKADIAATGRAVNWSRAVRPALGAAVAAFRRDQKQRARRKAGKVA
jgi:hypothetical protein